MSDTRNCPFCSLPTNSTSNNHGNHYLFKCPNCGMFLMYDAVYRRMADRGEYADLKPLLHEFIKQTPEDQIAYIGSKVSAIKEENGLYREYRPLKQP